MTSAVFRENGTPKTRQTYHIKSAAVIDFLNTNNASNTTTIPQAKMKNEILFIIIFLCPLNEGLVNNKGAIKECTDLNF